MSGVATEAATRYAVRSQDTASGLAPSWRTSAGSAGTISVWESAYVVPAASSTAMTVAERRTGSLSRELSSIHVG
jgi:hypothetical protein